MCGLENKIEAKLRAKRLEGYVIQYDKIAKQRTRLIHRAEHLTDTVIVPVDEEIQTRDLSSKDVLRILYMDGHGNICHDVPLKPDPRLWVSLRTNSCTPLLLSINNVSIRIPLKENYNNILTYIQTCQGSSVQIFDECVVLCTPLATFIESLHYLLIKVQVYGSVLSNTKQQLIGETVARPFTFSRNTIHKDRQFTHISESYPIIFNSEIVGSLCLRLSMLSHDYTIETTRHLVADCYNLNRLDSKEKRKLLDAQTQTVGYLDLNLKEKRL